MTVWGIKVAQQDKSIDSASDDQLVMSSEFNAFKIVKVGTTSIVHVSGTAVTIVTVAHGLDFAPICLAFVGDTGGYTQLPYLRSTSVNGTISAQIDCSTDSTNLTFTLTTPSANLFYLFDNTYPIKYYLLRETVN